MGRVVVLGGICNCGFIYFEGHNFDELKTEKRFMSSTFSMFFIVRLPTVCLNCMMESATVCPTTPGNFCNSFPVTKFALINDGVVLSFCCVSDMIVLE